MRSVLLKFVVGPCAATKAAKRKETSGASENIVNGFKLMLIGSVKMLYQRYQRRA